MKPMIVLSSVDDAELGSKIAGRLVELRHAACVNLLPGVRSFYRWQGKICSDQELMLVIKTSEEKLDQVYSTVRELHSYELPELVAVEIASGDPEFLEWLAANLEPVSDAPSI